MNNIMLQGTRDEGRGTKDEGRGTKGVGRGAWDEGQETRDVGRRANSTAYFLLLTVFLFLFSVQISAQEYSTVHQDESLKNLIEKYRSYQQKVDVAEGYRIQITYTTDRDEAYKSKAQLYKEFDAANSYIDYEQPNYKLRVGDFKTRLEATAFLQQVISLYPGAFIVKDRVKIK